MLQLALLRHDKTLQEVEPRVVCRFVDIQPEVDAQQELLLHSVDFRQFDARNLGPRFVGVSITAESGQVRITKTKGRSDILVDEFVGHHKGRNGDPVFAAGATGHETITRLHAVNVV